MLRKLSGASHAARAYTVGCVMLSLTSRSVCAFAPPWVVQSSPAAFRHRTCAPELARSLQRRVSFPALRMASTGETKKAPSTGFDAEMTEAYAMVANSHRHPDGPWPLMLKAVQALSLGAGSKVLDIASGPGQPAATIAENLPAISVVSTDFSPDMVAKAKAICPPNMVAMQADAADLSAFEDNSFDVVTCCYGYMFPEDKAKAVAETLRVLKPGGTLIATYWRDVSMMRLIGDIMRDLLGKDPPTPDINPLSLAEENLFASLLTNAGFVDIRSSKHSYPMNLGPNQDLGYCVATMLVSDKIKEMGKETEGRAAFDKHVVKYLQPTKDGSLTLVGNHFVLMCANKK